MNSRVEQLWRHAAQCAHEVNRVYCEHIGDHSQVSWGEAPAWQRESAVEGVRQIYITLGTTPCQSHDAWVQKKRSEGWVHGEVKDVEEKTHPCLLTYEELPAKERVKDELFGAVVRAVLFGVG